MLINIMIAISVIIALVAFLLSIYYHFRFRKECVPEFLVSCYNLELLDQKKTACIIVSTIALCFAMIAITLRLNYIGG